VLLQGRLGDPPTARIEWPGGGATRGEPVTGDRVIRFATAAVVCAVAAFAAVVSYSHIYGLGRAHGQDGTAARTSAHRGDRPGWRATCFLRGEGVEQRESRLAVDVLVVPREQELDRDGDPSRRFYQGLVHDKPSSEDRGGDPGFDRRQRYPDRGARRYPIGASVPVSGSFWRASGVACHSGTARSESATVLLE
jgi:hypothetical protein